MACVVRVAAVVKSLKYVANCFFDLVVSLRDCRFRMVSMRAVGANCDVITHLRVADGIRYRKSKKESDTGLEGQIHVIPLDAIRHK